jgi:hypothetical protein
VNPVFGLTKAVPAYSVFPKVAADASTEITVDSIAIATMAQGQTDGMITTTITMIATIAIS